MWVKTAPSLSALALERTAAPLVLLDTRDRVRDVCRVPSDAKYSNREVVQIANSVVLQLLQLHPAWAVAVCCFYSVQVDNLLSSFAGSMPPQLRVDTVDGLQGDEFDAVVLAFSVTGSVSEHGHWQDPERVNVLLSRAKQEVVVIADSAVLITSAQWRKVLVAAPWVRFDVTSESSREDLHSALSCPRRLSLTDGGFWACILCCHGTDACKPANNFSRRSLKAYEAAKKHGGAITMRCIVCTMVLDKIADLASCRDSLSAVADNLEVPRSEFLDG